jgi:hypothetical protein
MEAANPNPLMSRAKHARIDVWRNEVAALDDGAGCNPDTASSAASTTSSSASSSAPSALALATATAAIGPSAPLLPGQSRGRRLWRRLSRRITGRPFLDADDVWDPSTRTDMYRTGPAAAARLADDARPVENEVQSAQRDAFAGADDKAAAAATPPQEELVALGADSSHGGDGRLKTTQERLERAARLLNKGVPAS